MKWICYMIAALGGLLSVCSLLEIVGVMDFGIPPRRIMVGLFIMIISIYVANRVKKIEEEEDRRGGPSIPGR
ncbi:MAG: hypothetical protein PUK54_11360 [Firmicutes bacterium]|nr:hypothetical protein [Bacillota bacterium]MDD7603168.1 hypothetical protein [Bacillota bacterium]MDY5856593.1 hypothetical protein [Anaerovoracaceae bacterium]